VQQNRGTLAGSRQRTHQACVPQAPLEFDAVHVDLSNKPRWYSSVHPRGLVPAVTVDGSTLLESLDICRSVAC
jgi:glutathione S-transferase